jgi:SAM-dependent methyltransferase
MSFEESSTAPDVAGDPAPKPHATAEEVEAARYDSKLAQVLYHDWEAESYDEKWSISYDKRCVDYARDLFDATVPAEELRELPYDRALELGCGSGFFLLNLIQAGVARRGSVTDLSPGMVKVATRNGENLGLDIDGRVADAEGIPYDDNTFDLVVGHAVLHHIPDVELSLGCPGSVVGAAHRPSSTSPHARPRWRRSSTCTPSRLAISRRWPAAPAQSRCRHPPPSSLPRCWAGRCARSKPPCPRADWVGATPNSLSTAGSR